MRGKNERQSQEEAVSLAECVRRWPNSPQPKLEVGREQCLLVFEQGMRDLHSSRLLPNIRQPWSAGVQENIVNVPGLNEFVQTLDEGPSTVGVGVLDGVVVCTSLCVYDVVCTPCPPPKAGWR
ncbi:hypothetical protein Bbelb_010080 [Branchiostoma belcheri]|nr:hypothetical protein Bbelb_010080 [Branchiostoma belcheri]